MGIEEVRVGKIGNKMATRQRVRGNGKASMLAGTTQVLEGKSKTSCQENGQQ